MPRDIKQKRKSSVDYSSGKRSSTPGIKCTCAVFSQDFIGQKRKLFVLFQKLCLQSHLPIRRMTFHEKNMLYDPSLVLMVLKNKMAMMKMQVWKITFNLASKHSFAPRNCNTKNPQLLRMVFICQEIGQ